MSSEVIGKLPKPQMRRLLRDQIKRSLIGAFIMTVATGVAMKLFYVNPRKQRYAEFYKNYDIDKEFNIMRNKGVFDSCEPDPK